MRLFACFLLALLTFGCPAATKAPPKKTATTSAQSKASQDQEADSGEVDVQAVAVPGSGKFSVPFAYEVTREEPLAVARGFLRELLADNATYAQRGSKFFQAFAESQAPRVTIVTCSDSRVQAGAWDATPENDDYTVRNMGNQVDNNLGSIEYGVEHLHTPLLLIVGHTGCGAVRAAMGDTSKLSPEIQAELKGLSLPKPITDHSAERQWAEAVVANVHRQVAEATKRFAAYVQQGKLTVVGVVYDLRNDLDQGYGKLLIVNVNGNVEPERMKAFVMAILGSPGLTAAPALGADRPGAAVGERGGAPSTGYSDAEHADDEALRAMARLSALRTPSLVGASNSAEYPGVGGAPPLGSAEPPPAESAPHF